VVRPTDSARIDPAIAAAMDNPDFYPDRPDGVELVQTPHIFGFLAG